MQKTRIIGFFFENNLWEGADKSLARPTSWFRMESIVSLERGVSSCVKLQVFSCYRGWKEACQVTRNFNNTETRAVINFFFSVRQGTKGNSHHSERNITPPQKIPSTKINWTNSCLNFFGSRRHPPHWLSSKRPNYQCGVLLVSAGAIEGHFQRKSHGKVNKGVLFLHDNAPAHRALATQKKPAYLGFQCLHHPPYSPDLAPFDYHLFPGLKNNWKVAIFRPTWRSLLPQRPGWTDNLLNCFWVACRS